MSYYITKISISINAKSDKELVEKVDKILYQIRGYKDINPYIDSCKKAVFDNEAEQRQKFESIDNSIIKKLNSKKN